MLLTPKDELEQRLFRLQAALIEGGLDGALLQESADLFYFSGTAQQAYLFVPAQGKPLLLVRKSVLRAQEESALEEQGVIRNLRELPSLLKEAGMPQNGRLGLELDVLPTAQYFRLQELLGPVTIADVSPLVRRVRMVKSSYEIDILRRTANLSVEVFQAVRAALRAGMREVELAALVEYEARRRGHQGPIRVRGFNQMVHYGHVMAGPDAAYPSSIESPTGGRGITPFIPQGSGLRRIEPHEPILMDFGMAVDGYVVDQTRVFCIGNPPQDLARAHEVALTIESRLANMARPGIAAGDLYQLARRMVEEAGLTEHFMGYAPDQVAFVGHGVGLELNELPPLAPGINIPLEINMVLAIEPKFVFPGRGVVGIEDTFVITDEGAVPLSPTLERGIMIL